MAEQPDVEDIVGDMQMIRPKESSPEAMTPAICKFVEFGVPQEYLRIRLHPRQKQIPRQHRKSHDETNSVKTDKLSNHECTCVKI